MKVLKCWFLDLLLNLIRDFLIPELAKDIVDLRTDVAMQPCLPKFRQSRARSAAE